MVRRQGTPSGGHPGGRLGTGTGGGLPCLPDLVCDGLRRRFERPLLPVPRGDERTSRRAAGRGASALGGGPTYRAGGRGGIARRPGGQ